MNNMKATPLHNEVLVECIEDWGTTSILTVKLYGDDHYSMFKNYQGLADVLLMNGRQYGKSCWNSDRGVAYYRTDMFFATAVS